MNVLGIETSCDETAAALVEDGSRILSNVVASQVNVHSAYGGVVPELASREHASNINHVVDLCLEQAWNGEAAWDRVDAIAVTRGPGLVGALLVGMAYAKALSFALEIPMVGVNHLEGHIRSVPLEHPEAELPALALVVSGGHTSLFHLENEDSCHEISRTRDDAAGEALDKLSKALGLGYPGGPVIDRLAPLGNTKAVRFTLPRTKGGELDFSFSGIKTAALRHCRLEGIQPVEPESAKRPETLPKAILDLVASYQKCVVDQLLDRIGKAWNRYDVRSIQISGGVSANSELRRRAAEVFRDRAPVHFPSLLLSTDNAAMIAAAGHRRLAAGEKDSWDLTADPNLPL